MGKSNQGREIFVIESYFQDGACARRELVNDSNLYKGPAIEKNVNMKWAIRS